jgi:hypothetical protein
VICGDGAAREPSRQCACSSEVERAAVERLRSGAFLGESGTRHSGDSRQVVTTGVSLEIFFPRPNVDGHGASYVASWVTSVPRQLISTIADPTMEVR